MVQAVATGTQFREDNDSRGRARAAGILFIVGTVSGILSVILTTSPFDSENYLTEIRDNENQIISAALLVVLMAVTLAMIPVVLYPILKRYNQTFAIGAILFRGAMEAVAYLLAALSWFMLVVLSQQANSHESASTFDVIGRLLLETDKWSGYLLSIVFCVGSIMISWIFFTSGLIPRWLSGWGLGAAVLYFLVPTLAVFGADQFEFLQVPLAIQELVLAIWLIVRGFRVPGSDQASLESAA